MMSVNPYIGNTSQELQFRTVKTNWKKKTNPILRLDCYRYPSKNRESALSKTLCQYK